MILLNNAEQQTLLSLYLGDFMTLWYLYYCVTIHSYLSDVATQAASIGSISGEPIKPHSNFQINIKAQIVMNGVLHKFIINQVNVNILISGTTD